jgi:tetratricopeptide (TPR) repeat protein
MSAAESVKRGRYSLCSDALASVTATSTLEDLRTALFCSYSIGRDDRVLQATQAILKGHPADPAALYWRVQSMERAGLAALTTATQLNPESASLHALMGDLLRAKGDLAEAAGEYRKAIAIQPGFLAAHLGLARDLYSDRKLPEAEGEVRGVLGASDQDPEANYLLGEILVNREALEDAFPYLQKALRASAEELPYVHADLGRVYEERGDAIHAIAELKQSVQRDADGSYNYRLGRLLMMTGDRAAAKAAFETSTRLRHETDAASLYEKE